MFKKITAIVMIFAFVGLTMPSFPARAESTALVVWNPQLPVPAGSSAPPVNINQLPSTVTTVPDETLFLSVATEWLQDVTNNVAKSYWDIMKDEGYVTGDYSPAAFMGGVDSVAASLNTTLETIDNTIDSSQAVLLRIGRETNIVQNCIQTMQDTFSTGMMVAYMDATDFQKNISQRDAIGSARAIQNFYLHAPWEDIVRDTYHWDESQQEWVTDASVTGKLKNIGLRMHTYMNTVFTEAVEAISNEESVFDYFNRLKYSFQTWEDVEIFSSLLTPYVTGDFVDTNIKPLYGFLEGMEGAIGPNTMLPYFYDLVDATAPTRSEYIDVFTGPAQILSNLHEAYERGIIDDDPYNYESFYFTYTSSRLNQQLGGFYVYDASFYAFDTDFVLYRSDSNPARYAYVLKSALAPSDSLTWIDVLSASYYGQNALNLQYQYITPLGGNTSSTVPLFRCYESSSGGLMTLNFSVSSGVANGSNTRFWLYDTTNDNTYLKFIDSPTFGATDYSNPFTVNNNDFVRNADTSGQYAISGVYSFNPIEVWDVDDSPSPTNPPVQSTDTFGGNGTITVIDDRDIYYMVPLVNNFINVSLTDVGGQDPAQWYKPLLYQQDDFINLYQNLVYDANGQPVLNNFINIEIPYFGGSTPPAPTPTPSLPSWPDTTGIQEYIDDVVDVSEPGFGLVRDAVDILPPELMRVVWGVFGITLAGLLVSKMSD